MMIHIQRLILTIDTRAGKGLRRVAINGLKDDDDRPITEGQKIGSQHETLDTLIWILVEWKFNVHSSELQKLTRVGLSSEWPKNLSENMPPSAYGDLSGYQTAWKDGNDTSKNGNPSTSSSSFHRHHLLMNHLPGLLETKQLIFSCIYGTDHIRVLNEQKNEDFDLPISFSSDFNKKRGTCVDGKEQKSCPLQTVCAVTQPIKQLNRKSSPHFSFFTQLPRISLYIDGMTAGAQNFIVLDFGYKVMLSDLIVPASEYMSSLRIDAWLKDEKKDSIFAARTSEIGAKSLTIKVLLPPIICRFLKLTYTVRQLYNEPCTVNLGQFFGVKMVDFEDLEEKNVRFFLLNYS
uniref:Uncharacterized protein n=1 Tax=Meloidogyne javanica TaxID=6303 RepID=A0A915LW75_MELJA